MLEKFGVSLTRNDMKTIMGGFVDPGGGSCTVTFSPSMTANCPPGETSAGCFIDKGGTAHPYCYVDSTGYCYEVGAATCTQD